ncbi:hypothetical protein LUZ60_007573 [Juncus effusus]|nr:hypothetical protein LUZ60_007573 [Juncus effusus]
MAPQLSFLLLLTTCSFFFLPSLQIQTSQTQLLLQIRKQLEFPQILDSWQKLEDICLSNPTSFLSVTCQRGVITELKIIGDKLDRPAIFSGFSIPNQTLSQSFVMDSFITTLTRLTSLKVVILVSLGLWGPLTDKIHRLNSLELLDLSSNFIYGSIPPKLAAIEGLQTLTLDNNYFNGSIPDWFDSFSNLTVLRLQRNTFQGEIPNSISQLNALTELSLSSNNLSGKIPDLNNLKNLKMLDLRVNGLNSNLPVLPNGLVNILLSKNSLNGEIPDQYTVLNNLQHLDLSFNFLTGTPPEKLFSLPNLSYINLGSNMFFGSISQNVACNPQLGFVDLSTNRLFGNLPSCLNSNSRIVKYEGNCFDDLKDQHNPNYCEENSKNGGKRREKTVLMATVIGGACFVILFFLGVFFVICRKSFKKALSEQRLLMKQNQDNSSTGFSCELLANARYISQTAKLGTQILPTYRVFNVEELKEATKNFERSSFIGEGSIGKLYKGRLENGTYVAIRCLSLYKKYSIRNLKLRLDLIAKLRHPNLVCLLGHCIDATNEEISDVNRVFLVYEFVPNGTLRARLLESNLEKIINYPDRLQVLIGIAKAVHFLHTGIIPGSANNRLRMSNILIDEHFVAKLSDYGLSIITEEIYKRKAKWEDENVPCTGDSKNSEDDVYSFGYIILESLMGPQFNKGEFSNIDHLIKCLNENEERELILDPIVISTSSHESLSVVISIASKCVLLEASRRPSIEEVLWNLQYASQVQGTADVDQRSEVSSHA